MKKRIIPIITCLIVLLLFSSCDGSLTQNLNKFLNIANGNVFINSGLIKVDLAAVNNVVNTITEVKPTTTEKTQDETTGITTTKKESGETKLEIDDNATNEKANISVGDINIEVKKEDVKDIESFTPPMTESELDSLNAKLNGIVSSEKKTEELVKQLAEPVAKDSEEEKATKGTFTLTAAVAKKAADNANATEEQKVLLNSLADMATKSAAAESTTAADVLTSKLIMGIVTQASKAAAGDAIAKAEATKSIIDQASTLITISKKQIGSFDILSLDGIDSLLSSTNSKSLSSGDTVEDITIYEFTDTDIRKKVSTYRPMIYSALVSLYSFNGTSFDSTKEQALVNSYKTYYNATLALLSYADEATIEKLEIDDLLKMATSAVVMQLDEAVKNANIDGLTSISKLLTDLFTLNPWILKNSDGNFPTITESVIVKLPGYLKGKVNEITKGTKPSDFINNDGGIINETNLYAQLNTLDSMMEKAKIKISNVKDFKLATELNKILGKTATEN